MTPRPRRVRPRLLLPALVAVAGLAACRGGSRSGAFSLRRDPVERFDPRAPWVPPLSAIPVPGATAARPAPPPSPASPAPPPSPSRGPGVVPPPAAPPVALRAAPVEGSTPIFAEEREVGRLTRADFAEFNRAWALFVAKDRAWPAARDAWIARGGAAPYVLAENLFRYFLSATAYGSRTDIYRVASSAAACGEPAVGYFGNLLIRETWPLKEPVVVRGSDGSRREVREWTNDDVTRQHCAIVLGAIGEPSVPRLASSAYLSSPIPSARRYVLAALGRVGTGSAIAALASAMSSPDWQDRGAAVKALGIAFAWKKNPSAKPVLERALSDPDEFVRRKAREGVEGRAKPEF